MLKLEYPGIRFFRKSARSVPELYFLLTLPSGVVVLVILLERQIDINLTMLLSGDAFA